MDIKRPLSLQKTHLVSQKKEMVLWHQTRMPYLPLPFFVLFMTCISEDIKSEISEEVTNKRIPGLSFDVNFYADDTILYSLNKKAIEELLEKVERNSKKYGLALNKDRCVNLNVNTDEEQVFSDGESINADKTQLT